MPESRDGQPQMNRLWKGAAGLLLQRRGMSAELRPSLLRLLLFAKGALEGGDTLRILHEHVLVVALRLAKGGEMHRRRRCFRQRGNLLLCGGDAGA